MCKLKPFLLLLIVTLLANTTFWADTKPVSAAKCTVTKTFSRSEQKKIFREISATSKNNSSSYYGVKVTGCTKAQANSLINSYVNKYLPYGDYIPYVSSVDGKTQIIAYIPCQLKASIANSGKNRSTIAKWVKNSKAASKKTQLKKAKAICKYIRKKMSYKGSNGNMTTALSTHKGSCETYAKLFRSMCNYSGLSVKYVLGYRRGKYHA